MKPLFHLEIVVLKVPRNRDMLLASTTLPKAQAEDLPNGTESFIFMDWFCAVLDVFEEAAGGSFQWEL
jgi:hypothetical protein